MQDSATPGSVARQGGYPHVDALIERGGQIMIGTIEPIRTAAVAHDGRQTLAMLRCGPKESLLQILERLEAALVQAQTTGQRVDDINRPGKQHSYVLGTPSTRRGHRS